MKISLEDDEFKQAYVQGNFAVDCLEITLTQNGSTTPRIYTLAGSLYVSPDNGVEARLVWRRDATHPYDNLAQLNASLQIQSGALYPEHHYYSLNAIDTSGRIWTHPAANLHRDDLPEAEILTIQCDFIRVELATQVTGTLAHFIFHDDLGIRVNLPQSSTNCIRGRKRIRSRPGHPGSVDGLEIVYYRTTAERAGNCFELTAIAAAEKELLAHFDDRLLEAIQFCAAKMAWPIMREVIRGGRQTVILSKSRPFNNGLVGSAVPYYLSDDFFRLMERFYLYTCAESDGEDQSPLWKKIGGLFTLKGVWIDSIVLLTGVAVESILNDSFYKKFGVPDDETLRKIHELIDSLKQSSFDPVLINRATASLGNMKSSSATDRLYALIKNRVVDQSDIDAWKSLRHSSAHGSLKIDPSDLQKILTQVNHVQTLIYKLVFFRIGFTGQYTNFSKSGWPPAKFNPDPLVL